MSRAKSVGLFEQLVLTAILELGGDAYGVAIHRTVSQLAASKRIRLGAIYVTLDRLEDMGYVSSWLSDPRPERGGRARRHYQLEAAGRRALRESAETAKRMYETVVRSLGTRWRPARQS
jgi:DNA-binding PadR family transcriptional regulator